MWIDFEGIDGSGKTAVSTRVAEMLRDRGIRVVHAREGGTFRSSIAGRVRDLVRSQDNLLLRPQAELLLNLAREAQLTAEVVLPALRDGAWVITDRTSYSHLALAQYVRGIPRAAAEGAADLALQGLRPDRVFVIDVDPDVARWRRRIRKIRDRRASDPGRKGLYGERLANLTREAFRDFATAEVWTIVDNTWNTFEETVAEVLAALDGRPAQGCAQRAFRADPTNLLGSYLAFAAELPDRSLAAMLAAGLDDPRADRIRRAAPPDEAAYALSGMDTPEAWTLRDELKGRSPDYVARSLMGLPPSEAARRLRRELESSAPAQVIESLRGDSSEDAHALRRRHVEALPDETLRSLKGLDDESSWILRRTARKRKGSAALAESVTGLDSPRAWDIRNEFEASHPLAVARSLQGVGGSRAWEIREKISPFAPKTVLASISGMDDPEADRIRTTLHGIAPDETAASLRRLDSPTAWRWRNEMKDAAPVGVIKSLRGADRSRGEDLVSEIMHRRPERLRVAREAVQFTLEAAWMAPSI